MNAGGPFDLIATTDAAGSTFAGIIRLVEEASASSSPSVRLADRLGDASPSADDACELQRLLYGLYALLELHFAQKTRASCRWPTTSPLHLD